MTIAATQSYLKGLVDGLVWPFPAAPSPVPNLVAYITPPDPNVEAMIPTAYIWPSHGDENRDGARGGTVPRALTLGGASGFKGVIHDIDLYLVYFLANNDADADNLFPAMVDTIMSALRVSTDPVKVTDPYTSIDSWLIDVGERMTYQITVRSLVDQGFNRYDALLALSINELIAA